jgi:hypothetical protein
MVFDDIPLIDGHAHPIFWPATTSGPQGAPAIPFVRAFTEGHEARTIEHDARHTLLYRQVVRELAALLGCEANDEAVLAARAAVPFQTYLRRLLESAHLEAVVLDDGYPRSGALSVAELARQGGVRTGRALRLESLIEGLIPAHETLPALETAMIEALEAARPGLVALKSIIAYRGGLAITPPSPDPAARGPAARALAEVRASWGGTPGRLAAKPLLDYLLPRAATWAAAHRLPLQLHTGFGDRDLDLRLANPLHLRPLLEDGTLTRGPLVLLHAAYPYCREAAYLASVYPNVYVDVSLATPLLAGPVLTRVLEELLALAPVTKVLYGSDAWGIPEWFWCAAWAMRRALGAALAWLPGAEGTWAARRILRENALDLYPL